MSRINSKFIVIAISVLLLLYFVIFPMGILLYDSIMLDAQLTWKTIAMCIVRMSTGVR